MVTACGDGYSDLVMHVAMTGLKGRSLIHGEMT